MRWCLLLSSNHARNKLGPITLKFCTKLADISRSDISDRPIYPCVFFNMVVVCMTTLTQSLKSFIFLVIGYLFQAIEFEG